VTWPNFVHMVDSIQYDSMIEWNASPLMIL